jgi:tetratricopeptide (TPR) repeat protein
LPGQEPPLLMETPTALSTPATGAAAYQLRAWDQKAALNLIETAQQFSYADNVPGFFGNDDRSSYINDQMAVRLAALDALHRFPTADFSDKLQWRVALANTTMYKPDSDAWILQQLANWLNTGRYKLDELNGVLSQYGFEIGISESAPNLLGRDQAGQILEIGILENHIVKILAALGRDNQGHSRLIQIPTEVRSYQIADHTGDGIPEIILSSDIYNGSYTGSDTLIFQWQDDHFANLLGGELALDQSGNVEGSWQYGAPDANGAQPIEVTKGYGYTSYLVRFERYKWNGKSYQLAESRLEKPDSIDRRTAEWPALLMGEGDYKSLIRELPVFLSSPSKIDDSELGLSYVDYLRFQLAQAYALNAQRSLARETLQRIISKPKNPEGKSVLQAAQAYLDAYTTQGDVYRACQSALTVMAKAAGTHLYGQESADSDYVKQAWGYDPDMLGYTSNAVCSLRNAFTQIAKDLKPAQFEQAPEQLKQAGVLVRSATEIDLDGNGQMEWVLLVDTPGDDAPLDILILTNTPKNVLAMPVVEWDRKKYDLPQKDTDLIKLEIKTVTTPDGKIISIAKLGTNLYAFQMGNTDFESVLTPDGVESYVTRLNDDGLLELEITPTADSCQGCSKSIYVWSTVKDQWFSGSIPDEYQNKQDSAEAVLLTRWQPDQAIPMLQKILKDPDAYQAPYYMYLLGLAYEIKGDDKAAVQAYWNLWQSHPESSYARMVQARLELRK